MFILFLCVVLNICDVYYGNKYNFVVYCVFLLYVPDYFSAICEIRTSVKICAICVRFLETRIYTKALFFSRITQSVR